jgi:hypothetical protein
MIELLFTNAQEFFTAELAESAEKIFCAAEKIQIPNHIKPVKM